MMKNTHELPAASDIIALIRQLRSESRQIVSKYVDNDPQLSDMYTHHANAYDFLLIRIKSLKTK